MSVSSDRATSKNVKNQKLPNGQNLYTYICNATVTAPGSKLKAAYFQTIIPTINIPAARTK